MKYIPNGMSLMSTLCAYSLQPVVIDQRSVMSMNESEYSVVKFQYGWLTSIKNFIMSLWAAKKKSDSLLSLVWI